MKVIVTLLALLVAMASAFDFPEDWENWKKTHSKSYVSDEEEIHRHVVWQANKKYIDEHNQQASVFGYTLAMNEFGDMESAEFTDMYNGYKMRPSNQQGDRKLYAPTARLSDLPSTVDWRTKGYVTPIKNQGQCGSCWAFSATGSLEGQHFKATGKLVSLSEQNLVDCSKSEGNEGCNGGLMDDAFQYVKDNGGLDTESSYPYKAVDGNCHYNPSDSGTTCSGYVDIKHKNETDLQVASATVGPISVAIDASHLSFQFYHSGVYDPIFCSQTSLDHGVLVVGYGTDSKDYWLVKNSWGTSWGMSGYIKMVRNNKNKCGIASQASYPLVP